MNITQLIKVIYRFTTISTKTYIMKSIFTYLFILSNVLIVNAQNDKFSPKGGEFKLNEVQVSCLTKEQSQNIIKDLKKNELLLKSQNKLAFLGGKNIPNPLFIWPVKKLNSLNYNSPWSISNYVDHNTAYPNQLEDYTGGTKTYDLASGYNHEGVDIYTWPFTWKMMDNDEVEIIAASDGQIIAKGDGEFDRNCGFNSLPWNAVYVQHNDGSVAWYGHMKSGSLTSKIVGDMVTQGEFLGVVGSSGSSSGPHLHFQVWEDSSYTNLIDPYSGPSNTWNTDSWWQNQKPYLNPEINAALTHIADPIFGTCPTTEITNESNQFDSDQTIFFTIFLKDQTAGSSINLKVIKPDNTTLYDWDFTLTDYYSFSW